jgi:hypothetical protein
MIFVNEAQRRYLELYGRQYGIEWLERAARLEDPRRRNLPETHWLGTRQVKRDK